MLRKILIVALVLFPAAAHAEPSVWGEPNIDYRLTMTFSDDTGRSTDVRLFYTPDRQRLDYVRNKQPLVTVVDKKAKRIFSMNPNRKLYQLVRYQPIAFTFNVTAPDAKRTKVGEETISGIKATKYNVESKTAYGDQFAGFAWITDQLVVVKLDGAVTRRGQTKRLQMSSKDLVVGDLPGSLFALPDGYKELKANR